MWENSVCPKNKLQFSTVNMGYKVHYNKHIQQVDPENDYRNKN